MTNLKIFPFLALFSPVFWHLSSLPEMMELDYCEPFWDSTSQMILCENPTQMPKFPGGDAEFHKYLRENIVFPESEKITGNFRLEFIVDKSGEIFHPKAYSRSTIEIVNAENGMLRPLQYMPCWQPALCDSTPVAFRYSIRINICRN